LCWGSHPRRSSFGALGWRMVSLTNAPLPWCNLAIPSLCWYDQPLGSF